ncbi:MAG: KUP/HAK/KT family potassium transporter [Verrucomicrobiales bacterium]|jgi:KUP system potassium uptake protein|nr:KUP/HAK/KT family potassium transporter [Verrucomicrobiales bacterium]
MSEHSAKKPVSLLGLVGVLGIVYGDIGTSPLYAFRQCFYDNDLAVSEEAVLGVCSLVFWALMLVVTVKYLGLILRADNRGEGGTFALLALLKTALPEKGRLTTGFIFLGICGACLLYADALITPSISILSAMEGLKVLDPDLQPWIVPASLLIIVALFWFQRVGTGKLGVLFGPVMLLWFVTLGTLGLYNLWHCPRVALALNPWYAVNFLLTHGLTPQTCGLLGSLFLVMTGAETLYADMGHFNAKLIRRGWLFIVLPALTLNYYGQGARLLLKNSAARFEIFYELAPAWGLVPLIIVTTITTVIAAQAVISGAYSLTAQAIQLGYCPRLTVRRTSNAIGQIYLPLVNWLLMTGCLALVLIFGESARLARAYGFAVSGAMLITSVMFFFLARARWKWPLAVVVPLGAVFLAVDLVFLTANTTKLFHGGLLPLGVGAGLFIIVSTWRRGRHLLRRLLGYNVIDSETFVQDLTRHQPLRVAGTAVYLTANSGVVPRSLLHNYKHNKVIHQTNVFLTVQTASIPYVHESRAEWRALGAGFHQIILRYGFREHPNVPWDLQKLADHEPTLNFATMTTSYFLARLSLIAAVTGKSLMPLWQRLLFSFMFRNALDPAKYFQIPANRVIELGEQLTI